MTSNLRSFVCVFGPDRGGLLADRLQGIQSAFDVPDLSSQSVYGLHGTIQLLTAGH